MNSDAVRKKFFEYWNSAPRNCATIPNVSLVPNNDSTLLFVNSGMFPLAPYLAGEKHPLGSRLCNFQRCLRPKYEEILEIGDNRHTICFEMMGDWSLGDFDKTSQIPWILELFVKSFGLDPSRIYVSVFGGNEMIPRDDVAIESWQKAFNSYGVSAEFEPDITKIPANLEEGKTHSARIFPYDKSKNWWQRGEAAGELGGPSSEIFYDLGETEKPQKEYHINDDSGRFVEIGNNVFMEYYMDEKLNWLPLAQKNIDFGGGFERLVMCLQGKTDIFETDLFYPMLEKVAQISGKEHKTAGKPNENTAAFRVLADHARASTFIIADGIIPSNKDQGYILRRFIRRMIRFGKKLGIERNFGAELAQTVISVMQNAYPYLLEQQETILQAFEKEENTFRRTLANGLKEIEKIRSKNPVIDGKTAFYIYETFGFPIEMTLEEFGLNDKEMDEVIRDFKVVEQEHKAKSRQGAEQKFKGGLADQSVEVTKLHTAHHLVLKALQSVVSPEIHQRGSNITGERLRIDFNYSEKLTPEQIEQVETWINEKIAAELPVTREDMPKAAAEKLGAEMEFGLKYPDTVSVYTIQGKDGTIISREFCGGPHVTNTKAIGEGNKKLIISEQENIGGGLRRIKAKLVAKA